MIEASVISIDHRSGVPLYRQIVDQVLVAVSTGRLKPGARLRTVRQLAIDAQINPNTVSRAYRELEIRGFVRTRRGTGTFIVGDVGAARDEALHAEALERFCDQILSDAGRFGFTLLEIVNSLQDRQTERR